MKIAGGLPTLDVENGVRVCLQAGLAALG